MRSGIAHAYFFLGRYDEAASAAAMALQENPAFQPSLRISAATHAMAGRLEQARQEIPWLRRLYPALCISNVKDVLGPYQQADLVAQYVEGLRKAGLPE
jgi:adenylate cyclase